jgi:hypothetical protein
LQYKDFFGPKPLQFTPLFPGLFSALMQLSRCSREGFKKIPSRGRQRKRRFYNLILKFFKIFFQVKSGCMKRSPQGVGSEKGRSVQVLQKNSEKFFKANKKTPLGGTAKGAAQGRKSEMKS